MDRRAWLAKAHGVAKCLTRLSNWHLQFTSPTLGRIHGSIPYQPRWQEFRIRERLDKRINIYWLTIIANMCKELSGIIFNLLFSILIIRGSHSNTENQIDYILCSQRQRSSVQSAKTRPGADCGSDHELLIAKFRLKLKKVWKTTTLLSWVQFNLSVVSDSLRPRGL